MKQRPKTYRLLAFRIPFPTEGEDLVTMELVAYSEEHAVRCASALLKDQYGHWWAEKDYRGPEMVITELNWKPVKFMTDFEVMNATLQ